MRIVSQEKKKIISVLGLPHSGTTVVCNIFNSMNNAFCISEPHWILLSKPKDLRFDKIGSLSNSNNVNQIMDSVLEKLFNSKYDFGGVKETFRPTRPEITDFLNRVVNKSDILVFVIRDPKAHYNSLKATTAGTNRNPIPIDRITNDTIKLEEKINQIDKNKRIILKIEDLCNAGNRGAINYINNRSNGIIDIRGDFVLNPTNYIYGNHLANRSNKIKGPNMSTKLLTQQDIKYIDKEIMPIYNRIAKL